MTEKLAPGAPPGQSTIPLAIPELRGNEWEYVQECLSTGWVSSAGPFVDRFERETAAYLGAKHAVAVVNGTAAIHVALLLAGVQRDDEVIVPSITFIAPANAVRYAGAWPIFIDAEPDYWQLDSQKVAQFLQDECKVTNGTLRNKTTGRRISAVLTVHILGHPCDSGAIREVAANYGLPVIGDATESLGARYKEKPVGTLESLSCLSFNGNKIMTTGGGGMILTDNDEWAAKARYLTTQAKNDPLEYIHNEVGFNYRMPNVLAAIGCAQLEQLESFVVAKRRIAQRYADAFAEIPGITVMPQASWAFSTYWLYTILVDESKFGMSSRSLIRRLIDQQIQSRPLWQPLHRSLAHAESARRECPVADRLYQQAVSLPSSTGLTEGQQQKVINAIITGLR